MKRVIIIDSTNFGKSMELVECIKDKISELEEMLSHSEMSEENNEVPYIPVERKYTRGRYNY